MLSSAFSGREDSYLALQWVEQLRAELQDADYPIEAGALGRTLIRWKHQIAAWHKAHVSNGPTEAVNNLIKRGEAHRAASRWNTDGLAYESMLGPGWSTLKAASEVPVSGVTNRSKPTSTALSLAALRAPSTEVGSSVTEASALQQFGSQIYCRAGCYSRIRAQMALRGRRGSG